MAVTEMEEVLKEDYINIKSKPKYKKVTNRGSYYISVDVERYNEEYLERKDLIKTVTVNVEYTYRNSRQVYTVSTLATK